MSTACSLSRIVVVTLS
uniref:Uncharacterized protein n=1 Tax=Arundo donax TaxID=35708 RepID=A0A0A9FW73_ARUDO